MERLDFCLYVHGRNGTGLTSAKNQSQRLVLQFVKGSEDSFGGRRENGSTVLHERAYPSNVHSFQNGAISSPIQTTHRLKDIESEYDTLLDDSDVLVESQVVVKEDSEVTKGDRLVGRNCCVHEIENKWMEVIGVDG